VWDGLAERQTGMASAFLYDDRLIACPSEDSMWIGSTVSSARKHVPHRASTNYVEPLTALQGFTLPSQHANYLIT